MDRHKRLTQKERGKHIAEIARIDAAMIVLGGFLIFLGFWLPGLFPLCFGIKWVIEDAKRLKKYS